jgi:hypothetical protein
MRRCQLMMVLLVGIDQRRQGPGAPPPPSLEERPKDGRIRPEQPCDRLLFW